MKIKNITNYLESAAPLSYQENYDNAGLITGNAEKSVKKALLCIDCTEKVVEEAHKNRCGLIISHHPVIFNGLKKLTGRTYTERILIKAIKYDIAIYAIHTNLDNTNPGINSKLCEAIGLQNYELLVPFKNKLRKLYTFCPVNKADKLRSALFKAGAGHIGNYSDCSYNSEGFGTFKGSDDTNPYIGEKGKLHKEKEVKIETIFPSHLENEIIKSLLNTHPYEEPAYDIIKLENKTSKFGYGMIGELKKPENCQLFLNKLKKKLNLSVIRHTELVREKVNTIAVCGGSGSFLLSEAIKKNADIFITSDLKYHQFFDADGLITIADIGHYESERITIDLLYDVLRKKFTNFAFLFTNLNTNPIKYLR